MTNEKNKTLKFTTIPKKARYLALSVFRYIKSNHVDKDPDQPRSKTIANLKVYFPKTYDSVLMASAPELFSSHRLSVGSARAIAWRLAVNARLMRSGYSVSPKAQVKEHVALAKVTSVNIDKNYGGKNRIKLVLNLTVLTGFLAGSVRPVILPHNYGPILFRNLVGRLRFSYSYSPLLLGGLKLLIHIVPREEGQDITQLNASPSNRYSNTKLTKARFREVSPCVHEDKQIVDCLLCSRGRQSCRLGLTLYDRIK